MSCVCSTKTTRYIYGYERNFVHEYLYKCVCVKKLCYRFVVHLSVASLHFNHNCNQHEPFRLNFMYACILPFERNDLLNVLCSSIFNRSNLLSDKRFIQKAGPIFLTKKVPFPCLILFNNYRLTEGNVEIHCFHCYILAFLLNFILSFQK